MIPLTQRSRLLLAAALVLLVVNVGLVVARPGDLGDDEQSTAALGRSTTTQVDDASGTGDAGDDDSTPTTRPRTSTTADPDEGAEVDAGTDASGDADTQQAAVSSTTTPAAARPTGATQQAGATTSTTAGSGLGASGSGSAGASELADTGGLPLALPAALLLAAALGFRRIATRSR